MNLEVLVLPVFNGYHIKSSSVREHQASWFLDTKKKSFRYQWTHYKGHPSSLLFTHLACNIRSQVLSLKPAGSYWAEKPDHSCMTSASEQQTHARKCTVNPLLNHCLVCLCVKSLICPASYTHAHALSPAPSPQASSRTIIPAICPWQKWRCWALTRRRGSNPSTLRW